MKKILALAGCLLAFAGANAQRVAIAPEFGLNLSNVRLHDTRGNLDEYSSGDPKLGFKLGGVVDLGITHHFSIQPGLFWSMKGYRLVRSAPGVSY